MQGFYRDEEESEPLRILLDLQQTGTRFHRPVAANNTLLISLTLDGQQNFEDPMKLAYQRNLDYYSSCDAQLTMVSLAFDLHSPSGKKQYQEGLDQIISRIPE